MSQPVDYRYVLTMVAEAMRERAQGGHFPTERDQGRQMGQHLVQPPGLFPGAEWQAPDKAAPGFEGPQKSLARGHHLRWCHAHAFLAPPAPATRGVKAGRDGEEFAPALGADQRAAFKGINHLGDFGEDQPRRPE